MALSFTAFLNDGPIRIMVGSRCDNVWIAKETKNTITLAIRPESVLSQRLTLTRGVWAEFHVGNGHPVLVLYKQRKSGGYQLCFEASQWVKIYRPGFIGIE